MAQQPSPGLTLPGLIGGVAVMAGGIVLLVLGQHEVGAVLAAAGAAELGVKVATLG